MEDETEAAEKETERAENLEEYNLVLTYVSGDSGEEITEGFRSLEAAFDTIFQLPEDDYTIRLQKDIVVGEEEELFISGGFPVGEVVLDLDGFEIHSAYTHSASLNICDDSTDGGTLVIRNGIISGKGEAGIYFESRAGMTLELSGLTFEDCSYAVVLQNEDTKCVIDDECNITEDDCVSADQLSGADMSGYLTTYELTLEEPVDEAVLTDTDITQGITGEIRITEKAGLTGAEVMWHVTREDGNGSETWTTTGPLDEGKCPLGFIDERIITESTETSGAVRTYTIVYNEAGTYKIQRIYTITDSDAANSSATLKGEISTLTVLPGDYHVHIPEFEDESLSGMKVGDISELTLSTTNLIYRETDKNVLSSTWKVRTSDKSSQWKLAESGGLIEGDADTVPVSINYKEGTESTNGNNTEYKYSITALNPGNYTFSYIVRLKDNNGNRSGMVETVYDLSISKPEGIDTVTPSALDINLGKTGTIEVTNPVSADVNATGWEITDTGTGKSWEIAGDNEELNDTGECPIGFVADGTSGSSNTYRVTYEEAGQYHIRRIYTTAESAEGVKSYGSPCVMTVKTRQSECFADVAELDENTDYEIKAGSDGTLVLKSNLNYEKEDPGSNVRGSYWKVVDRPNGRKWKLAENGTVLTGSYDDNPPVTIAYSDAGTPGVDVGGGYTEYTYAVAGVTPGTYEVSYVVKLKDSGVAAGNLADTGTITVTSQTVETGAPTFDPLSIKIPVGGTAEVMVSPPEGAAGTAGIEVSAGTAGIISISSAEGSGDKAGKLIVTVTALAEGEVTLTASLNGNSSDCTVSVKKGPVLSGISEPVKLYVKGTRNIELSTIVLDEAREFAYEVLFTPENDALVDITKNEDGTIAITGKQAGQTDVTVTLQVPNLEDQTKKFNVSVGEIPSMAIDPKNVSLHAGETKTVQVELPEELNGKEVVWTSNMPSVAAVAADPDNGTMAVITAANLTARGEAAVTASVTTDDSVIVTAECSVEVVPRPVLQLDKDTLSVYEGQSQTVIPSIVGDQIEGINYRIEADSENDAVSAAVQEADGSIRITCNTVTAEQQAAVIVRLFKEDLELDSKTITVTLKPIPESQVLVACTENEETLLVGYDSLDEAFDAISDSEGSWKDYHVSLQEDIAFTYEEGDWIGLNSSFSGNTVELDLNGHTISSTVTQKPLIDIHSDENRDNGTLIIKNGTVLCNDGWGIYAKGKMTLILDHVTISGSRYGVVLGNEDTECISKNGSIIEGGVNYSYNLPYIRITDWPEYETGDNRQLEQGRYDELILETNVSSGEDRVSSSAWILKTADESAGWMVDEDGSVTPINSTERPIPVSIQFTEESMDQAGGYRYYQIRVLPEAETGNYTLQYKMDFADGTVIQDITRLQILEGPKLTLNTTTIQMNEGEAVKLNVQKLPEVFSQETVRWKCSDETVVKIEPDLTDSTCATVLAQALSTTQSAVVTAYVETELYGIIEVTCEIVVTALPDNRFLVSYLESESGKMVTVGCDSLDEAFGYIAAMPVGESGNEYTVSLQQDVQIDGAILRGNFKDRQIVLDLKGYSINCESRRDPLIRIQSDGNGGSLTIKNGSIHCYKGIGIALDESDHNPLTLSLDHLTVSGCFYGIVLNDRDTQNINSTDCKIAGGCRYRDELPRVEILEWSKLGDGENYTLQQGEYGELTLKSNVNFGNENSMVDKSGWRVYKGEAAAGEPREKWSISENGRVSSDTLDPADVPVAISFVKNTEVSDGSDAEYIYAIQARKTAETDTVYELEYFVKFKTGDLNQEVNVEIEDYAGLKITSGPEELSLSQSKLDLFAGREGELTVNLPEEFAGETIDWETTDPNVVTAVSDPSDSSTAKITAVGAGSADVKATVHSVRFGDVSGTCRVTVKPMPELELDKNAVNLYSGVSGSVTVTQKNVEGLETAPVIAASIVDADQTGNPIERVDYQDGKLFIKAKSGMEAQATATVQVSLQIAGLPDDAVKKTVSVTVYPMPVVDIKITEDNQNHVYVGKDTSVTVEITAPHTSIEGMTVGTPYIVVANADESSIKPVKVVRADGEAYVYTVTGLTAGTAKLTAKLPIADEVTADSRTPLSITVNSAPKITITPAMTLVAGKKGTLNITLAGADSSATLTPDSNSQSVTCGSVSSPDVSGKCTVEINPVSAGTAVVTVTAQVEGYGAITARSAITVIAAPTETETVTVIPNAEIEMEKPVEQVTQEKAAEAIQSEIVQNVLNDSESKLTEAQKEEVVTAVQEKVAADVEKSHEAVIQSVADASKVQEHLVISQEALDVTPETGNAEIVVLQQTVKNVETTSVVKEVPKEADEGGNIAEPVVETVITKIAMDISLVKEKEDGGSVPAVKQDNTVPIVIPIVVPEGVDPSTVKVRIVHDGTDISYANIQNEGGIRYFLLVTYSFSPFEFEFMALDPTPAPSPNPTPSHSGGSGGGGGGSRKPASGSQGIVTTDPKKGKINSLTGIITAPAGTAGYSSWRQEAAGGWKLFYADGTAAAGTMKEDEAGQVYEQLAWEQVNGAWYAFGADGIADSGMVYDRALGGWFYIDINTGMKTGWQLIDGNWHYFHAASDGYRGRMLINTTTPDGYAVDMNGIWDKKEKITQ